MIISVCKCARTRSLPPLLLLNFMPVLPLPTKTILDEPSTIHAAIGCVICTGPILTIIGIAFLAAATTDTRTAQINTYNTAVSTWVNTGYNAWSNATSGSSISASASSTVTLSADTTADVPAVESASGVQSYSQRLRYDTGSSPFGFQPYFGTSTISQTLTLTKGASTLWSVTVPTIFSETYNLRCSSSDTVSQCANKCNGQFNNGAQPTCTQWWVLNAVCVVLSNSNLNPDPNGYGCVPLASGVLGISSPNIYNQQTDGVGPFGYQLSTTSPGSFSFSGTVTVRSSADPWVIAARQSEGDFDWPLSVAAKVGIGLPLLIVGIILTVAPWLLVAAMVKRCSRRKGVQYPNGMPGGTTITVMPPAVVSPAAPAPSPYQTGMPAPVPYGTPVQPGYPAPVPQQPYAPQPQPYPPQPYAQQPYAPAQQSYAPAQQPYAPAQQPYPPAPAAPYPQPPMAPYPPQPQPQQPYQQYPPQPNAYGAPGQPYKSY